MKTNSRKLAACFVLFSVICFGSVNCSRMKPAPPETEAVDPIDRRTNLPLVEPIKRDFSDIKTQGVLTVLAPYNSTTYFLYRGEPMGYEYELLKEFAKETGLEFKITVVTDHKSFFPMLNAGDGDIVAARLIPTDEDRRIVAFTRELYRTAPALVQQETEPAESNMSDAAKQALKPSPDEPLPEIEIQAQRISRPEQLAGEQVDVPAKTAYKKTLLELEEEISGDIHIVEWDGKIQDEGLAQKVAGGEIEFTVLPANLADLKEAEFKNLKIRPIIGASQSVAWAVRNNAPELKNALDAWIAEKKNTALFERLYKKYYKDRKSYRDRVHSEYLTNVTGKLSEFDSLLQQHAPELPWDWRLLAAQTFQESRFKPAARSWAGAAGLLQLMPATARQFGVQNPYDPADNVQGAVKFLKWLDKYWTARIDDEDERLKFILASYNTGHGHVEDAQRLAKKYGDNPLLWKDVSYWLLQKSTQQYSNDEVVKFGFCRGIEPVNYVSEILDRFGHYQQFVVAEQARSKEKSRRKKVEGSRRILIRNT
jgi:membrane-bound lytic murein transglycosylase F